MVDATNVTLTLTGAALNAYGDDVSLTVEIAPEALVDDDPQLGGGGVTSTPITLRGSTCISAPDAGVTTRCRPPSSSDEDSHRI